jgi:hypothetical protein
MLDADPLFDSELNPVIAHPDFESGLGQLRALRTSLPDVAQGRCPVRVTDELQTLIDETLVLLAKIQTSALFVADDADNRLPAVGTLPGCAR